MSSQNGHLAREAFVYLVREHIRARMDDPVGAFLVALMERKAPDSPLDQAAPPILPAPAKAIEASLPDPPSPSVDGEEKRERLRAYQRERRQRLKEAKA